MIAADLNQANNVELIAISPGTVAGRCTAQGSADLDVGGFPIGPISGPADFDWLVTSSVGFGAEQTFELEFLGSGFTDFTDIEDINCLRGQPPDGAQLVVPIEATTSDENCGTGFGTDVFLIFGTAPGADGFLLFPGEGESQPGFAGRPFDFTDDNQIVIDRFEFPVSDNQSVFESFLFDLDDGTGTLESEFDDTICNFGLTFDPDELGFIDEIVVADPPETQTSGSCTPDDTTMCLNNNRFQVELDWDDGTDGGEANASELDPATGLFFFFNEEQTDVLLKVINGCQFNGHFWVFAAGATDVEFTLTVTDTATSETKQYSNPLGDPAQPTTDTSAFATCP